MPGPVPKPALLRQRKNRASTSARFVDQNPLQGVPELPKRKRKWRAEVVAWWHDLWTSPMVSEYIQSDTHGLFMLADMMDRYYREPTAALATEIRLQRQCFGLTPIDRRRLQWEIERGEEAQEKSNKRKRAQIKPSKDPRGILGVVK